MYKHTASGILRKADNAIIPLNTDNSDYVVYLKWVSEGGITEPEYSQDDLIADGVTKTKDAAGNRILDIMPTYKQINALARFLELTTPDSRPLTAGETQELSDYRALWDRVKLIRSESQSCENCILAATNKEAIDTAFLAFKNNIQDI